MNENKNGIPKEPFKVKGTLDFEISIDFEAHKFNINTLTGINLEDNPEAYLYIFGLVSSEVMVDYQTAEKPVIETAENKEKIDRKKMLEASTQILSNYVSQIFGLVQEKYHKEAHGED